MRLKVVSWNIWVDCDFDAVKRFLKESDADIFGLQEVWANDKSRDVVSYLNDLGYKHAFTPIVQVWGGKTYHHGPAIFSRHKIVANKKIVLSEPDTRVAVKADIQVGDRLLHVISTHLVHTHQQPSAAQDAQAANLIKEIPKERTIVMGDFNATPDSSVIQKMQSILVDADPASQPTWSTTPDGCLECSPQSVNTRLDYIFTTSDIKTDSFKVEHSTASDHLPISVMVEV